MRELTTVELNCVAGGYEVIEVIGNIYDKLKFVPVSTRFSGGSSSSGSGFGGATGGGGPQNTQESQPDNKQEEKGEGENQENSEDIWEIVVVGKKPPTIPYINYHTFFDGIDFGFTDSLDYLGSPLPFTPNAENEEGESEEECEIPKTWDSHTDNRIKSLDLLEEKNILDKKEIRLMQNRIAHFIWDISTELNREFRVTDTYRTHDRQNELESSGKSNARGGESYHNYGLAIDIIEIKDGLALYDEAENHKFWEDVVEIAERYDFEWGGNWEKPDRPHFQLTFGLSEDDLQAGERPNDDDELPPCKKIHSGQEIMIGN
ncbi:MAG: M15 family metallopeptidase [Pseudohongiellaceae bacterium]